MPNLSDDYISQHDKRQDARNPTRNLDRWYRMTGIALILLSALAGVYVVSEFVHMVRQVVEFGGL